MLNPRLAVLAGAFLFAPLLGQSAVAQSVPELPDHPNIIVRTALNYYDVEGRSLRTLDRWIERNSPNGYDAQVEYMLSSYWELQPRGNGCEPGYVEVIVDMEITYPNWVNRDRARQDVQAAWDARLARLEVHENGHTYIAWLGAAKLYNELIEMGGSDSCESLGRDMQRAAQSVGMEVEALQQEYDLITEHSRRQERWDWEEIAQRYAEN